MAEDKVRDELKRAVQKIDLTALGAVGQRDIVAQPKLCRKLLRLVYEHGDEGISKVLVAGNYDDGASPAQLPSGFKMIFDATKAPVVYEAFPMANMYAGTMALKLSAADLQGSPFLSTGPVLRVNELVQTLADAANCEPSQSLADGYVGIFSHESRQNQDYEHEYYAVVRDVKSQLNEEVGKIFSDSSSGKTLQDTLRATRNERGKALKAQRADRAQKISNALAAYKINISADTIMQNTDGNLVDNVSNTILTDDACKTAVLFSDVVPLHDETLDAGLVLTDTMRLGPTILRGEALGRGEIAVQDVAAFPSTVPTQTSTWSAVAGSLPAAARLDHKSEKNAPNSPYTWSGTHAKHPILARELYISSASKEWLALQKEHGFDENKSKQLRPLAVKLR